MNQESVAVKPEAEMNAPDNHITTLELNGKKIVLLGTAHVLSDSAREVREQMDLLNPDTVCVELCESRYKSLKEKDKWKNLDIVKVIREGKAFLMLANMILSSFQKRVGADLESAPGDEMVTAFQLAEEREKKVVLADRDINVTLKRAWTLSGFKDRMSIMEMLLESLFVKEDVNEAELQELLKGQDMMTEMMNTFAEKLPKVKQVLIDERDRFIAEKILRAEGNVVLAVIGRGHLEGIVRHLQNPSAYDASIETVPEKKKKKVWPWVFSAVIIGLLAVGFIKGGADVALSMIWAWWLVSAIITSIFTLPMLPHPVTFLLAWVAPLVKLVAPPLSAGLLMAPAEAIFRKPRVSDMENLNEDIQTFKGFWKNRVTRILLVFAGATVGASIGHTVALFWIAKLLAK